MKLIKVLGSGCAKCTKTAEMIQQVAAESAVGVSVIKETDAAAIMAYGVMSTPAVVVDERLVHSGRVPTREEILDWL